MARLLRTPLPDMTVHNLRRRAEQMRAIASALSSMQARTVLLRKADEMMQRAARLQSERHDAGRHIA